MTRKIHIFDTTLRDGEQSPGASMNTEEKLVIAQQLIRMGVDVIEAGFPISSPGDFRSVQEIGRIAGDDCVVCGLTRAVEKDIDRAAEALKCAKRPRIHTGIGVSPSHLRDKLRITEDECVERAIHCVEYAKKYVEDVEFYAEDAGRADQAFLERVIQAVVKAGATVVNIPDTTGYQLPEDFGKRIKGLADNVIGIEDVIISVHTHNDLGMATALALQGVKNGARQIECTINGLGERAGNTALEEVVMAIHTRQDTYNVETRIDTTQIYRSSKTVYNIIGQTAPLNKAIVGKNAFAHEAGIHQHGVLANKKTYEIMTPEAVGIVANNLVLGKHSGRHAFTQRIEELGYTLTKEEIDRCFEEFKDVCDKKKNITDADLEAIVTHHTANLIQEVDENGYVLDWFQTSTSNFTTATCTVSLKKDEEKFQAVALGDGPIDAAFNAIDQIIKPSEHSFDIFSINSISEGKDTLGDVTVKISSHNKTFTGRGLSTDIIEASVNAYLTAMNRLSAYEAKAKEAE